MPGSNWLLDLNLGGQAPCHLVTQAAMAVHLGLARHVVVYRAPKGTVWTRPIDDWNATVEVDGMTIRRFSPLD